MIENVTRNDSLKIYTNKWRSYFVNGDSLSDDALAWLRSLNIEVDLVVIDPPYNIADKGKVTKAHGKIYSNREAWGDEFQDSFSRSTYDDLIGAFLKRAFSILKDGGSLFCFIDRRYSGVLADIGESSGLLYIFLNYHFLLHFLSFNYTVVKTSQPCL